MVLSLSEKSLAKYHRLLLLNSSSLNRLLSPLLRARWLSWRVLEVSF